MIFSEDLIHFLVIHDSLSELTVCLLSLISLCQASSSTSLSQGSRGNKARIFLGGRSTYWWSERSTKAVVQLPAYRDPSQGLSISVQLGAWESWFSGQGHTGSA